MADEATERVFREDAMGVERLVAAPGDEVPDEDTPIGYEEKIDPRADTADAYLSRGETPPVAQSRRIAESVPATVEPDVEYEDPLPKPGEEGKGDNEASSGKARRGAADKSESSRSTKGT